MTLRAKSRRSRRHLAGKLIAAAGTEGATPVERYVLLRDAATAAAAAGDAEQAMQAVDGISNEFLIRSLDFKSSLLQTAARGALAKDPARAKSLACAAVDVAELKMKAADYEGRTEAVERRRRRGTQCEGRRPDRRHDLRASRRCGECATSLSALRQPWKSCSTILATPAAT